MIALAEYILHTRPETLAQISVKYEVRELTFEASDYEDSPQFNYFDRLMREVPRRGRC